MTSASACWPAAATSTSARRRRAPRPTTWRRRRRSAPASLVDRRRRPRSARRAGTRATPRLRRRGAHREHRRSGGLGTAGHGRHDRATAAPGVGRQGVARADHEDDRLREPRAVGWRDAARQRRGADRLGRRSALVVALFVWDYLRQRRRDRLDGSRSSGGSNVSVSEDGTGSSSKLRLSAVKANGRLLKGYGPLAALLVAFVLMAMLVPTKAPQQDVVHETQQVTGGGTGTGTGTSGTAGTAGHGGHGRRRGGRGRRRVRRRPGRRRAPAAWRRRPPARRAPVRAQQVPGDPYSPPCISFSGNNGGATSAGVSANADQRHLPHHRGLGELPADAAVARWRQHRRHDGGHRAHDQRAGARTSTPTSSSTAASSTSSSSTARAPSPTSCSAAASSRPTPTP